MDIENIGSEAQAAVAEAAPAAPAQEAAATPAAPSAPREGGYTPREGGYNSSRSGYAPRAGAQAAGSDGQRRQYQKRRKKVCQFCVAKTEAIDYKDTATLRKFITERSKILPRRTTGNCADHQRKLTTAIKQARIAALIPFVTE
jgi:small subunit ribosomal protein S18